MKLYYSGASQPNTIQADPSKSLGGFISSSLIPNASINNIFPPITKTVVKNLYTDCRLIVLKNTTGSPISNISFYTTRGVYATLLIATVAPAVDNCNNPVFESIDSGHDLPFQAVLTSHEGSGNVLSVAGPLVDQASIGIWIQRTLDTTQFTYLDGLQGASDPDCPTLATLLAAQQTQPIVFDNSQLTISW